MSDSTNIPEMRETIERLSKEKAAALKEVADVRKDLRVRDAKDAFAEAGYAKSNGELFVASNPEGEITAEAVVQFADQYDLTPVVTEESSTDSGDPTPPPADGSSELAPMAGSSSRSGDGGAGGADVETLTRDEWKALQQKDPSAAAAAIASGRVEISAGNPFVRGSGLPKGVNPYAGAVDSA